MSATFRNSTIVARREFLWRSRSRSFVVTTIVLLLVTLGLALAPVIINLFDRGSQGERVGVHATGGVDPAAVTTTLTGILAAPGVPALPGGGGIYEVVQVADPEQGRAQVQDGSLDALLAVTRGANEDLAFTLVSGARSFERTPQLLRQAASALAIQDRLDREGIAPGTQASLFAPPAFTQTNPDPSAGGGSDSEFMGNMGVGFILTIFIFMAIMLYGNWVAMSVAEEKSSRVMEVVLGAAKPFELLAGKVLGVGSLALLQYIVVFVPAAIVIAFQGAIAAAVLGDRSPAASLPSGVGPGLLAAFAVFFVLGFMLYAVLYAAAGSLVSRQEDVNTIVAPLTIISTLGYVSAAWAATGVISANSPLLSVLSYVPFTSPYLMLPRIATGQVGPAEVLVAIAILLVSIVIALWVASRIYAAGVLLYGQRPGIRPLWKAIRQAG